jgi:hypothetical protein
MRPLDRASYTRYLARTQFSFLAGLYTGLQVYSVDPATLGPAVAQACFFLLIYKAFVFVVVKDVQSKLRWRLHSFFEIQSSLTQIVGLLSALGGRLGFLLEILLVWPLFYPVRAVLLGARSLPWMIRPFCLRSIIQDGLPLHLRVKIAILSSSTLLPLGGLAIPLCLYIRDRHWTEALAVWAQSAPNEGLVHNGPSKPPLAHLQLERPS